MSCTGKKCLMSEQINTCFTLKGMVKGLDFQIKKLCEAVMCPCFRLCLNTVTVNLEIIARN